MGKKKGKKGGGGGGGGKKLPKVMDGLKPSEMDRGALLGFIQRLQVEVEKEREERNYYMLEREKIFSMWNLLIEKIHLEKERVALFEAHMHDAQKNKDEEDDLFERKLRFLKQEHTHKVGQVRIHHLNMMKHIQDDNWALMMVMREALMGKRREIRTSLMAFYQMIRGLHWKHAREVSDLRKDMGKDIRRLETTFDRRLFENNDRFEEEESRLSNILANSKEGQIQTLVESHHAQVRDLTSFFRDLLRHNLILIYGMKEAAKKQKTGEMRALKEHGVFKGKYETYISTALGWRKEIEAWNVLHAPDDIDALAKELGDLNESQRRALYTSRMIECSSETMQQRVLLIQDQVEGMEKTFLKALVQLQRIASMKRFVLDLKRTSGKREADLYEALADNIERVPGDTTDYFQELLEGRKRDLETLELDILDYATEHQNVEANYKELFRQNAIHLSDIGFPVKKTGVQGRYTEEDAMAGSDDSSRLGSKRTKSVGALSRGTSSAHSIGGRSSSKATSRTSIGGGLRGPSPGGTMHTSASEGVKNQASSTSLSKHQPVASSTSIKHPQASSTSLHHHKTQTH